MFTTIFFVNFTYPVRCLRVPPGVRVPQIEDHWSGNPPPPDLCSWGAGSESWLWNRLCWNSYFLGFTQFRQANSGIALRLFQRHFLPNPLQSIIYQSPFHPITENVVAWPFKKILCLLCCLSLLNISALSSSFLPHLSYFLLFLPTSHPFSLPSLHSFFSYFTFPSSFSLSALPYVLSFFNFFCLFLAFCPYSISSASIFCSAFIILYPCFEEMKTGLWNHLAVCLFLSFQLSLYPT
jgi:hypothetical protein